MICLWDAREDYSNAEGSCIDGDSRHAMKSNRVHKDGGLCLMLAAMCNVFIFIGLKSFRLYIFIRSSMPCIFCFLSPCMVKCTTSVPAQTVDMDKLKEACMSDISRSPYAWTIVLQKVIAAILSMVRMTACRGRGRECSSSPPYIPKIQFLLGLETLKNLFDYV